MFIKSWIQRLSNRMVFNRTHRQGSRIQSRRPGVAWQQSEVSQLAERLEERTLLTTFYVDDNFANPVNGQDPDGAGPSTNFGTDSFATIQQAINLALPGYIVSVYPGTYNETISINKSLTLQSTAGAASTIINSTNSGFGGGVSFANGVTNATLGGDGLGFSINGYSGTLAD